MFDVGFLELGLIMILALLVLGPERLPRAARQVGYWFGKARRYVEGVKSQVESEFDGSELKRLIHNQEVQIRELQNKLQDSGDQVNTEYQNMFDGQEDLTAEPEQLVEERRHEIIEEDEFENNVEEADAKNQQQATEKSE